VASWNSALTRLPSAVVTAVWAPFVTGLDLHGRIESGEQRMLTELARHAKAIQEAMSAQISVIDEKYADLPARVSKLEATVASRKRR